EDGIRDATVTGVQTCALPIFRSFSRAVHARSCAIDGATPDTPMNGAAGMRTPGSRGDVAQPSRICQCTRNGVVKRSRRKPSPGRSEERRVGKEGGVGGGTDVW